MINIGRALQAAYDDGYQARDDEIVRCKDCKYYPDGKDATMWTPCLEDIRLDGKWFCAYGERRDNA